MVESNWLVPATHEQEALFWEGGSYELNMSFDALRDKQWMRLLQALWSHQSLGGPLESRYTPGAEVAATALTIPPPTATQTQHGQLHIAHGTIGCNILATRSLFECVSVLAPVGMFANLAECSTPTRVTPLIPELDTLLISVALAVYDAVPFLLASLGWERECQVIAELRADQTLRQALLDQGNFLAQEQTLRQFDVNLADYEVIRPGLRWAPPRL